MEAAGLAFAILPLLKGPAKKFEDVIVYLARFKRFLREFKHSQSRLAMLAVIFKFQIQTILQCALSTPQATAMTNDLDHEAWTVPENEISVSRYLTSQGKVVCVDAIESITASLETVKSQVQKLDLILVRDPPPETKQDAREVLEKWKKRVLASPRACSLAKKIKSGMKDLEQEISMLREIVTEAEKCLQSSFRGPITSEEESAWHAESKDYLVTQKASQALFHALGTTCRSHKHSFHLTLNPRVNSSTTSRADFEIALDRNRADGRRSNEWLLICSSSTCTAISKRSEVEQNCVLKDNAALLSTISNSRKRVRPSDKLDRKNSDYVAGNLHKSVESPVNLPVERPLKNLSREMFLCEYISLLRRKTLHDEETTTVGFLSSDHEYKHLVYLCEPGPAKQSRERQQLGTILATSLANIPERIRIAKYLAQAPLHFATNPWLRNGWWTLKDISFFIDPLQHLASGFAEKPYITANVSDSQDLPNRSVYSKISNPLLFNLAIILIEIALGGSLREHRIPLDEASSSGGIETDLKTATRLSNNLGSSLGRKYRKAVEHCLNQSQNSRGFEDQEVQKEFFLQVVHPLRVFEREFDL